MSTEPEQLLNQHGEWDSLFVGLNRQKVTIPGKAEDWSFSIGNEESTI